VKSNHTKSNKSMQIRDSKAQDKPSVRQVMSVSESADLLRAMRLVPVLTQARKKKPIGGEGWADKARRMTKKEFHCTLLENPGAGLGILIGLNGQPGMTTELLRPRPGVIDIEVDDPVKAVEPLKRIWPRGIPRTLRFRSNRGRHYLFAIDENSAQALRALGITQAVIKDDPSYPGLELRLGTLDPTRRMGVQSVVPPTPRADGTPRKWQNDELLPLPGELIKDLGANSQPARKHAAHLAAQAASHRDQEPETVPREMLVGLSPLEKVRMALLWRDIQSHKEGQGYASRCPCHRGQKANFCFREVEPGDKVLIYCHRGCDFPELLTSLGLRPGDLYPDNSQRSSGQRSRCSNLSCTPDIRVVSPEVLERLELMQEEAREALQDELEQARELVRRLGLSGVLPAALTALELMRAGYRERNYIRLNPDSDELHDAGPAWTFPMVDAQGTIVNLQRRFVDESVDKRGIYGGRMGLFVPDKWNARPGPILLVEGASDTLALTACGHCAVGRPSNRGGLYDLAGLLKNVPEERDILVVGENDQRDSDWPGDPRPIAERLATALHREIGFSLPKQGFKDMREPIVHTLAQQGGRTKEA
jgi:Bifunctional DNA primase/polymerase, N-terminal